jgi:hypothetical protein
MASASLRSTSRNQVCGWGCSFPDPIPQDRLQALKPPDFPVTSFWVCSMCCRVTSCAIVFIFLF